MHHSRIGGIAPAILLLGGLLGCSTSAPTPTANGEAPDAKDKQDGTRVSKDWIEVRGEQLRYPLRFDALTKVIGQPNRTFKGVNLVHTWDDAGIMAYQEPGGDHVKELAFAYGQDSKYDFWPKSGFRGSVTVGSQVVTNTTGVRQLKTAGFKSDPLFPDFWDTTVGPVSVSVHLDQETHKKPVSIHLDFIRLK